MPNPIIQNYLNDDSIPPEKRKFAIDQINQGVPEEKIAGGITQKYGDIYNLKSRDDGAGEMSVTQFEQKYQENPKFMVKNRPASDFKSAGRQGGPQTDISSRIRSAVLGTKDAFTGALDTIAGGAQDIIGTKDMTSQANNLIDMAKKQYEKDKDKKKYDAKVKIAKDLMIKANDFQTLGGSKLFLGGVQTGTSPVAGAIQAFNPEIESAVSSLSDNNKERLQSAIDTVGEFTEKHPVLSNYTQGLLELGGLGAAGGAVKKVGGGVKNVLKTTGGIAGGLANIGLDAVGGAAKVGTNLAKKSLEKLKTGDFSLPLGPKKNVSIAQDLIRPEVNQKNLKIAAAQGLATEGKKTLFSGVKDKISLTPRMERAAETLATKFPDLKKVSSFELPSKINTEIAKIAEPLKESFKGIDVPVSLKESVTSSWNKLKQKQLKSFNASKWLKEIHQTFDKDYIKNIFKQVKSSDGKFRKKNVNDLWEMAKEYDDRYENLIAAVEKGSSDPKVLAQYEAFLENRRVIRDAMDNVSKTIADLETKRAFQEMSDLYEAQSQILKNIKPTNKTGESIAGSAGKSLLKQALPYGLGGGAVYGVTQ